MFEYRQDGSSKCQGRHPVGQVESSPLPPCPSPEPHAPPAQRRCRQACHSDFRSDSAENRECKRHPKADARHGRWWPRQEFQDDWTALPSPDDPTRHPYGTGRAMAGASQARPTACPRWKNPDHGCASKKHVTAGTCAVQWPQSFPGRARGSHQ